MRDGAAWKKGQLCTTGSTSSKLSGTLQGLPGIRPPLSDGVSLQLEKNEADYGARWLTSVPERQVTSVAGGVIYGKKIFAALTSDGDNGGAGFVETEVSHQRNLLLRQQIAELPQLLPPAATALIGSEHLAIDRVVQRPVRSSR